MDKMFLGRSQVKGLPNSFRMSIAIPEMITPIITPLHGAFLQSIIETIRTDKATILRIFQIVISNTVIWFWWFALLYFSASLTIYSVVINSWQVTHILRPGPRSLLIHLKYYTDKKPPKIVRRLFDFLTGYS